MYIQIAMFGMFKSPPPKQITTASNTVEQKPQVSTNEQVQQLKTNLAYLLDNANYDAVGKDRNNSSVIPKPEFIVGREYTIVKEGIPELLGTYVSSTSGKHTFTKDDGSQHQVPLDKNFMQDFDNTILNSFRKNGESVLVHTYETLIPSENNKYPVAIFVKKTQGGKRSKKSRKQTKQKKQRKPRRATRKH